MANSNYNQKMRDRKSLLAKLLADENIIVQHRNVESASFDTVARILTLPIWKKELSDDIFNLFDGHEVGHALYTPEPKKFQSSFESRLRSEFPEYADKKELVEKFFDVLNCVEDVRIEKLMARKYPGLRRVFERGYKDLHENYDFFHLQQAEKVAGITVNDLPLIDRVNIHAKRGVDAGVNFSASEKQVVDTIFAAQTFDDVLDATIKLLHAMDKQDRDEMASAESEKQNKKGNQGQQGNQGQSSSGKQDGQSDGGGKNTPNNARNENTVSKENDSSGDSGSDNSEQESDTENDKNSQSGNGSDDSSDKDEESTDSQGSSDDSSDDESDEESNTNNYNSQEGGYSPDSTITTSSRNLSKVDFTTLKNNTNNLVSKTQIHKDEVVVTVGKFDHNDYIIPFKDHLANFKDSSLDTVDVKKRYDNIVSSSRNIINTMAQEFMRKQAAAAHIRSQVTRSGDLDMNNLHAFRIKDDIFKRNESVPSGKNHGMVMVVDWSTSMSGCISDTLSQVMMLCMFCKRIGIPFQVYNFRDCRGYWSNATGSAAIHKQTVANNSGRFYLPLVEMYCFASSQMNTPQFNKAMKIMCLMANAFDSGSWSSGNNRLPQKYSLTGTPLNDAIMVSEGIVNEMRAKHRLDIVHTIFLTDGDSNPSGYHDTTNDRIGAYQPTEIILYEEKSGATISTALDESLLKNNGYHAHTTAQLLKWFRIRTNSRAIGYFIGDVYGSNRKKGFQETDRGGYTQYFVIDPRIMNIKSADNSSVQAIDSSLQNSRDCRLFTTKFIEMIATQTNE